MGARRILATTGVAAFACDAHRGIRGWNRAAEQLLGFPECEVAGKPCYEVLRGKDVFGNRFCSAHCPIHAMARLGEAIRSFELVVQSSSADTIRSNVSVILVPDERSSEEVVALHLLAVAGTPADRVGSGSRGWPTLSRATRPSAAAPAAPARSSPGLTPRETEILLVLSSGATTVEVADRLFISTATVRNHVHNLLRKLNARTRLEAVSLAVRGKII